MMSGKRVFFLFIFALFLFPNPNLFSMPQPFQDHLQLSEDDMVLPEKGNPFLFRRIYHGKTKYDGPLGIGWGFSFGSTLIVDQEEQRILLKDTDGYITLFEKAGEYEYRTNSNDEESLIVQPDGRIERHIKNCGKQIFGADGLLEKISDVYGHSFQLIYREGRLSLILTPSGREIEIQTDASGKITAVSEPGGKKAEYQYNDRHQLVSVKDMLGRQTEYAYDDRNNITEIKRSDGGKTEIVYKEGTDRIVELKGPQGDSVKYEYFNQKGYRVTFDSGYQIVYQDNPEKNQRIVSDNDGIKNILKYDENDLLMESKDILGRTSSFTYDASGRITEITDASGAKTEFTYDPNSGLLLTEKRNGQIAHEYAYDDFGNIVSAVDAQGRMTKYAYDAQGLLESLTDAKGRLTFYSYDIFGNVSQMVHSGNMRAAFQYDAYGNLTEETGVEGRKISYAYDAAGNLTEMVMPGGLAFEYAYDGSGNRIKETRSDGAFQEFVFENGRLVKKIHWDGGVSQFKYGPGGKLTEAINPNGSKNTYAYHVTGFLAEEKDSLDRTCRFVYDTAGRLSKKVYPNGVEMEFLYDSADRLIQKKISSGKTTLWNYHDQEGWEEMISGNESLISRYDTLGRLISSEDKILGLKVSFEYDGKGNISSVRYPNGEALVFFYDELNRPLSIKNQEGKGVEYQYSEGKMDYTARYSNGISENYIFDSKGLLKDYLAELNRKSLFGFALTRNPMGLVTEKKFLSGTVQTFDYDKMGRIVKFYQSDKIWEKYQYDPNGNILSVERPRGKTVFTYDTADQILFDGTFRYAYDANGNISKKTWADTTISFSFNEDNKLTGTASTSGNKSVFSYDVLGRKSGTEINGKRKNHFYIHENIAADLDEKGELNRIYFQSLSVDHPVFFKEGREAYFFHYDANANVIALTNDKGEVVNQYMYSPFGTALTKKETVQNAFQFSGREYDETFGLYFYRERFYDPAVFRFLSKDLMHAENMYVYADNDPVNRIDPFGLATTFTSPQARVNAIADGMGFNRPTYTPQLSGGVRAYGVHETTLLGNSPEIKVTRLALNSGADQVRSTIFHENVHELQRLRNPMQYASSGSGTAAEAALEREAHLRTYEYALRNNLNKQVQQHSLDAFRAYGGTQAEMEAYMARVGTTIPAEASALSRAAGVLGRGAALLGAAHISYTAGHALGTEIENRYHVGENLGIRDWEEERQIKNQNVERREENNLDNLESFVQSRAEINQIHLRPGVDSSNMRGIIEQNLENGRKPFEGLFEKPEERAAREQREREESFTRYEAEQARLRSEQRKKEEEFENNIQSQVQGLIGKAQGIDSGAQGILTRVQAAVQTVKNGQNQVNTIVNTAQSLPGKITQVSSLLQGAQGFAAAIQALTIDDKNVADAYGKARDAAEGACEISENMRSVNDTQSAAGMAEARYAQAQAAAAGIKGAAAKAMGVSSNAQSQLSQLRSIKQQIESLQSEAAGTKTQLAQLNSLHQNAKAALNNVTNAKAEIQAALADMESTKNAAKGLLAPYLNMAVAQSLLVQVNASGAKLAGTNIDGLIQEASASVSAMASKIGEVSGLQETVVPVFNMDLGPLESKVKDLRATADTLDVFEAKIDSEVSRARNCAGQASQFSQPRVEQPSVKHVNPPAGWSPVGESVAGPYQPNAEAQAAARQAADQQIESNVQSALGPMQPGQPQNSSPQKPQGPQRPQGPENNQQGMGGTFQTMSDSEPYSGPHYPGDPDGCM